MRAVATNNIVIACSVLRKNFGIEFFDGAKKDRVIKQPIMFLIISRKSGDRFDPFWAISIRVPKTNAMNITEKA
jgi:hypothetical protein